jgi:uncharacterized protein (DUF2225 family)
MPALTTIVLTCPSCGIEFHSEALDAYELPDRKHTDFHMQAAGIQPLPYGVHLCVRCGFAGSEVAFTDPEEVSSEVRRHLWDEVTPRISVMEPSASDKYDCAAKVASWAGAPAHVVGDLWLRAAWCCVDEQDVEAERYYRRLAAARFAESLAGYDDVPRAERAVVTYLVGELWRRIGDRARANAWFNRVAQEITEPRDQRWIIELARQQRDDPREWI